MPERAGHFYRSQRDKHVKLIVKAVAAGAATLPGQAGQLNPRQKIAAIAGLAGFVLRMFRSREGLPDKASPPDPRSSPGGARPSPARIRQGSSKGDRRKVRARFAAAYSTRLKPATVAFKQGGLHHG